MSKKYRPPMLKGYLSESNRIHELHLKRPEDQGFIVLDHPLDAVEDDIAVERLEQYMQDNTCSEMLKAVKDDMIGEK